MNNRVLGKIFGVSASKIRQLYMGRFESLKRKDLSGFLKNLQEQTARNRKRYGLRFLKQHEISWITSSETLRKQISFSLPDRCQHFRREFPGAKINPTLLRQIYKTHKIRKKKYRWFKSAKDPESSQQRQSLTNMKR